MPCVETKIVINGDSKPIFEIIKNKTPLSCKYFSLYPLNHVESLSGECRNFRTRRKYYCFTLGI